MSLRGYSCIGLDNPKYSSNVGMVLRACFNFRASLIITTGARYKGSVQDTTKAYRTIPLINVSDMREAIPFDCIPVAIDLLPDATPLPQYIHPERALYVFGAEDATLDKKTTEWCRDIIYIPTNQCMNLAATVHVVLYDRFLKQTLRGDDE